MNSIPDYPGVDSDSWLFKNRKQGRVPPRLRQLGRGQAARRGPTHPTSRPGLMLMLLLLTVSVTGCFRMSSDTEALRNSLLQSVPGDWEKEFEIGVGSLTFGLARAGLSFVELEPEARAALDTVRGTDVGVYRLGQSASPRDRAEMLISLDRAMTGRGWDRVVTISNRGEFVVVLVPRIMSSSRNIKVCLAVMEGRKLVIGSARTDLEPLLKFALSRQNSRPALRL